MAALGRGRGHPVRRTSLGVGALAGILALTAPLAGCGGTDHGGLTDVTLPSSLSITTTVPGAAGAGDPSGPTSTTTTEVPPTSPPADGAPVIVSLVAEPGAATCVGGTIPVTVTFEAAAQPPVRVFSVFLDGGPAGSSNAAQPITIPAVACDGGVHTVLFIATGTNGQSSTQAVAFRSPGVA
jgi:hypothetical protein